MEVTYLIRNAVAWQHLAITSHDKKSHECGSTHHDESMTSLCITYVIIRHIVKSMASVTSLCNQSRNPGVIHSYFYEYDVIPDVSSGFE